MVKPLTDLMIGGDRHRVTAGLFQHLRADVDQEKWVPVPVGYI
jgi:hypothetical protein